MHAVVWGGRCFLLCLLAAMALPTGASAQETSAEQDLAEKYAPIAYVKQQERACDTHGEPYLPVPVEIVFDDPEVFLKRHRTGVELRDPVVVAAPVAQDLAGKDDTHYLDLPGNARLPGCDYEKWSGTRMDEVGLEPTVYARLATEADRPGTLVLQYWFYWAFDDFNNTHESDWEMVQLAFEADTAEEALTQDPAEVVFAQHAGGERADWDDEKLQKDGDRLIVYPAAGSHATYYGDSIWIGWGAGGTGFGCDDTSAPLDAVPLDVVLLPDDPDPDGPFAWLLFDGRWGERHAWEFNGPLGPNAGTKWDTPVSWTDDVRRSSLSISGHETIGPGPASLFCTISNFAGSTATSFPISPLMIGYQAAAVALGLVLLMLWNWRYIGRAFGVYARRLPLFLLLSLSVLPVAIAGASVQDLIRSTAVGDWVDRVFSGSNVAVILGTGFAGMQQFLLLGLVAPAIIHATNDVIRHDDSGFRASWGVALREVRTTFGAILLNTLLLALMMFSVVLIPLAVYRGVQWLYTPHAVIIDGASWRQARHVSRSRVRGRWWRTLALSALVWLISGFPGPILANLLLLTGVVSLDGAELVSSVIYAIAFTVAIITTTLYYQRIGDAEAAMQRGAVRESPRAPGPDEGTPAPATLEPGTPTA